jgi:hypothetical protein
MHPSCALHARFSAGFIVFNLIVAVVCDAVAIVDRQARAADEEEKAALRDEQEQPLKEQREDPACDRDIVRAAQTRVWNLTTHVVMMRTRQEELLRAMAELSERVLDAQVEASRALGVPLLDDSAEYDDDEDDDGADEDAAGGGERGRASFDGGARTFQRQIDRVSARLDRLQDPSSSSFLASLSHGNLLASDDLSLSADTPVSRRLSSSPS